MPSQIKTPKANMQHGGDLINVDNSGDNSAIAAGRGAKASVASIAPSPELKKWSEEMEKLIDANRDLLQDDKTDLKRDVVRVAEEISKGKKADSGHLESLLNRIGSMAPDILEVAIATLANPLIGLGLVAKKIGDRAKVEQASS
jgi:hypothetical protein